MPVTEYGEIGVLIQPDEPNNMVIHWRVRRRGIAKEDNELYSWLIGDRVYKTSMGWTKGAHDGTDYFEPTERERSLRPCILRALEYAQRTWPGWRNETH